MLKDEVDSVFLLVVKALFIFKSKRTALTWTKSETFVKDTHLTVAIDDYVVK